MSSFSESWGTADPDAVGGGEDNPPTDGRHDVALIEAKAFTSKAGKDVVTLKWQTVDKAHEWTGLHGFKTQGAANFTKKTVRALGVDLDNVTTLDSLDQALTEKVGNYYVVDTKQNGDFHNTYLVEDAQPAAPDLAGLPPAPAPVVAGSTADDSIPF